MLVKKVENFQKNPTDTLFKLMLASKQQVKH